ncbi:MAG: type II toxin-antitoxin system prevent-host-death family antitoxin [Fimbriimonas sp.]|nr:type II toxin-antitoxin system prevent-host-death family antitoxin [Fimbriimonas sp.]
MDLISVQDLKAHLVEILKRVESGETVVVTRENMAIFEIRPIRSAEIKLGAFAGEFEIPEAAFAPLTTEEMKEWYGE